MNTVSVSSSMLSECAALVHAYIMRKHPRFSLEAAAAVVAEVEPYRFDPIKPLAKRVRAALAAQGVRIGHESSLQATARLQGFTDYFHVPKGPDTLEVLMHDAEAMRPVADWRACVRVLVDSCERWLQANPVSRLLRLDVSPNLLGIQGVVPGSEGVDPMPYPIALVRPLMGGTWLDGAASALESLRRRVEETQHATLDGLALVRYCSTRDKGALPYCPWGETQVADLPYSELVLMREDHDMTTGFEIVRGDEVGCWLQLLLDLKDYPLADIEVDEVGAWQCGRARYAWEVVTLRPHEVVPGLAHANLPTDESNHLLRRFQAAVRGGNLQSLGDRARRRLGGIDEPPTHCRLDAHRVLRALAERGETWESFCASIGIAAQVPTKPVELGVFLTLAEHLEHADPASLLLRPTRSELSAVKDDQLLRALMPRVNHVRYRVVTGLDWTKRTAIQEAVEGLATSIAMRNGALPIEPTLPDLVYAGDGEDLRQALEDMGLVMFVGVMPHLMPVPEEIRAKFPQLGRYAFGASLFVDIDVAA
jgi:hypothetical protein